MTCLKKCIVLEVFAKIEELKNENYCNFICKTISVFFHGAGTPRDNLTGQYDINFKEVYAGTFL